jgi:hypothetical protein
MDMNMGAFSYFFERKNPGRLRLSAHWQPGRCPASPGRRADSDSTVTVTPVRPGPAPVRPGPAGDQAQI